jgi:hypothetical protein
MLREKGYKNVVVIWGGQSAMTKAGFPWREGNMIKKRTPLGKIIRLK